MPQTFLLFGVFSPSMSGAAYLTESRHIRTYERERKRERAELMMPCLRGRPDRQHVLEREGGRKGDHFGPYSEYLSRALYLERGRHTLQPASPTITSVPPLPLLTRMGNSESRYVRYCNSRNLAAKWMNRALPPPPR